MIYYVATLMVFTLLFALVSVNQKEYDVASLYLFLMILIIPIFVYLLIGK